LISKEPRGCCAVGMALAAASEAARIPTRKLPKDDVGCMMGGQNLAFQLKRLCTRKDAMFDAVKMSFEELHRSRI